MEEENTQAPVETPAEGEVATENEVVANPEAETNVETAEVAGDESEDEGADEE